MNNKNYLKGILFGSISLVLVSLQPIVAIARPKEIDAYIFAAMTVIIEATIFFPLMLLELQKVKKNKKNGIEISEENILKINGWKNHKGILLYIGLNFAIAQIVFFVAYELSGAINGSLAQQTLIIWGLLLGYLINHDKVNKSQIIFSAILIFGLILAITQGSFNLIELNFGVILLIFTTMSWTLAHTVTRPILDKEHLSTLQLVFIRNFIGGIVLFSTYFIFYPLENISLLFKPINIAFFLMMGFLYGFDVLFWYRSLSYLELSKATIIVAPMPILTSFFAFLILGEIFTIFHLIGAILVVGSIIMIVKKEPKSSDQGLNTEENLVLKDSF